MPDGGAGRQFATASLVGSGAGLLVFLTLLTRGFTDLAGPAFSTNFYDLQAESILHGHLFVPNGSASLEGIVLHGHTYIYFGPFLALARIPIDALWPHAAGHLTQLSMALGACVLLAATSFLLWSLRSAFRGRVALSRAEQAAYAGFLAVVGGGSVVLYLAGSPSVYYETELWGAALAVAALAFFVRYLMVGSLAAAVLLSVATLFDALTRISVAIGPIALTVVALATSLLSGRGAGSRRGETEGTLGPTRSLARGRVAVLGSGAVAALVVPALVNWLKFRSFFSIPWTRQVATLTWPMVQDFYRHHGVVNVDNLFSTVGWYFRPLALSTTGLFPFFQFTSSVTVARSAAFLSAGRSSSVPSTMPLFAILGLVGLVVLCSAAFGKTTLSRRARWALWLALGGSILSAATVLVFDTIANRYLADLLPFVILTAGVGFSWLVARWATIRWPVRGLIAAAAVGLSLVALLVNVSLGLEEGLVFGPSPTPSDRAALVSFQLRLHQDLPFDLSFPVVRGDEAPSRAAAGELFVQQGCAGVYQENPPGWNQLEVGAAGGRRILKLVLPEHPRTVTEPLLVAGKSGAYQYFDIEYRPSGTFRLRYESQPWNGLYGHRVVAFSPWRQAPSDRTVLLDLTIPIRAPSGGGWAEAIEAGAPTFFPEIPVARTSSLTVGRFPDGDGRFTGKLTLENVPTPLCHLVLRAAKKTS